MRDDVRGCGVCTCGMVGGRRGRGGDGMGLLRPVRRGGDDGVCFEKGRAEELGTGGKSTDSQRDISRELIELSIRGETGSILRVHRCYRSTHYG